MRIVYVRGFRHESDRDAEIVAGRYPHQEHSLFVQRADVEYVTYDDVEHLHPGLCSVLGDQGLLNWTPAACLLKRLADADLIVASGEDVGLPLALQSRRGLLRAPIWIITHGFLVYDETLVRLVRDAPDIHFLAIAHSIAVLLRSHYAIPAGRVHTLGWAVDTEFFRPADLDSSVPALVVAAGTANRDYGTLIRAMQGIDVPLRIAADSAWFPQELDIAGETIPDTVTIGSCLTYRALRDLYALSSVVVVPLHAAPFACGYAVVAEAMAMGKPVIATRTAASSDFIIDGVTGLYVRPGDYRELAAKLRAVLSRPADAQRMGESARDRVAKHFSHQAYYDRLVSLIGAAPSACAESCSGITVGQHGPSVIASRCADKPAVDSFQAHGEY